MCSVGVEVFRSESFASPTAINEPKFIYLPCRSYMMLYVRLNAWFFLHFLYLILFVVFRWLGSTSLSFIHRKDTENYLYMKIMTWKERELSWHDFHIYVGGKEKQFNSNVIIIAYFFLYPYLLCCCYCCCRY